MLLCRLLFPLILVSPWHVRHGSAFTGFLLPYHASRRLQADSNRGAMMIHWNRQPMDSMRHMASTTPQPPAPDSSSSVSSSSSQTRRRHNYYQVTIEYCTKCRWGLRSFWMAQELLTTFQDDDALQAVTVIPSRPPEPGGVFVVKCYSVSDNNNNNSNSNAVILWDRQTDGGFPEIKNLKQRVRDQIDPDLYLGHSDQAMRQEKQSGAVMLPAAAAVVVPPRDATTRTNVTLVGTTRSPVAAAAVAITYCTGCKWLLRAAYMAQELISTFDTELGSLSLIPSRPPAKGGQFTIALDDTVIWDREVQGGFPEVPVLKQLVRDRLAPTKDLGHSDVDKKGVDSSDDDSDESTNDLLDDEETEEARKFFGVF